MNNKENNNIQKNLEKFLILMNRKAKELNMVNSVFNDPAGVENYSTAKDMLNCLVAAANTEIICDIWSLEKDKINIKGPNEREIIFESKILLGTDSKNLCDYYKVIGGKGGTLNIPKIFNLAVVVEASDNARLGCVVMNANGPSGSKENRFAAAKQAIELATGELDSKKVCAKSAIVCAMPENKQGELTIIYEKNSSEITMPASTSKMLTAIIVSEVVKDVYAEIFIKQEMIDIVPDKFYQNDFKVGDIVSIRDLISAMFLPSSNAAAFILASVVGGMI